MRVCMYVRSFSQSVSACLSFSLYIIYMYILYIRIHVYTYYYQTRYHVVWASPHTPRRLGGLEAWRLRGSEAKQHCRKLHSDGKSRSFRSCFFVIVGLLRFIKVSTDMRTHGITDTHRLKVQKHLIAFT